MSTDAGRVTAVDSAGYVYDVETGEVLGREGVRDELRIETEEDAEWALRLRSEIEGDIVAAQARLAALKEQMEVIIKGHQRRLNWWNWRFGSQLEGFARSRLNGRSRTWRCPWGQVSFRRVPDSRQIVDAEAALEFVKTFVPEAVQRREWVTLKAIDAALGIAEAATGERETPDFLVVTPGGETAEIKTGIFYDKKGGES